MANTHVALMSKPLFSVIIPAYNGEDYIADAVTSALAQTCEDYEVIVVNDGSTDSTVEKLQPFGSRINVLSRANGGTPAGARNFGLASATGEFAAFLDHDDVWRKDKLTACTQAIEKHPGCGFIFSDFNRSEPEHNRYYALSNSQIFPVIYEAVRSQLYEGLKSFAIDREIMFELLLKAYPIYPSTMVIRRELCRQAGLWNEDPAVKGNEDFAMSLACSLMTDFAYIDRTLVTVRRHGQNLSSDTILQREGDIRVLDGFLQRDALAGDKRDKIVSYKGHRYCGLAYNYLRRGRKHDARKNYLKALSIPGWRIHALSRLLASSFR